MMYHHDTTRTYEQAASDAAREMRARLQKRIDTARTTSRAAIDRVFAETPRDMVVPGPAMQFQPHPGEGAAVDVVYAGKVIENIHPHALGQFAAGAQIPRGYLCHLAEQGEWGRELAAMNLNTIFAHDDAKHLIRSVASQTRGFLSTKYRRLHSGALLEAFMGAAGEVGALPYEAQCTDTKWIVRAVCEEVIEPVPNEVLALGVVIHESPYGNGATEVSPFIERMWCTNLAVCSTELRKVHIGARLPDGVQWSSETMDADTKLLGLQVRDLVRSQLGADARARLGAMVVTANEQKVDPHKFATWLRTNLSKAEAEGVIDTFRSADIVNLPAGDTKWRASNAVSWFAHSVTDAERKFDLAKLAGEIVQRAAA